MQAIESNYDPKRNDTLIAGSAASGPPFRDFLLVTLDIELRDSIVIERPGRGNEPGRRENLDAGSSFAERARRK